MLPLGQGVNSTVSSQCRDEQIVPTTSCVPPACYAWLRSNKPSSWLRALGLLFGLQKPLLDLDNDGNADTGVDDPSDPVATEDGWRRFHMPHRYRLGWLPSSQLQVRHRRS